MKLRERSNREKPNEEIGRKLESQPLMKIDFGAVFDRQNITTFVFDPESERWAVGDHMEACESIGVPYSQCVKGLVKGGRKRVDGDNEVVLHHMKRRITTEDIEEPHCFHPSDKERVMKNYSKTAKLLLRLGFKPDKRVMVMVRNGEKLESVEYTLESLSKLEET